MREFPPMLTSRVREFIEGSNTDSFDELALAAFALEYRKDAGYRRLCERAGALPAEVASWREVPPRAVDPKAGDARVGDASAGDPPASHARPANPLGPSAVEAAVRRAGLLDCLSLPALDLIPDDMAVAGPEKLFVDGLRKHSTPHLSVRGSGDGGARTKLVRAWLAARQRAHAPGLILAPTSGLAELLDALERLDLRFRLPAGSVIFDLEGDPGGDPAAIQALSARLAQRLAVPVEQFVRHLPTPTVTPLLTSALTGSAPDTFVPPPWLRLRILAPESLEELPAGKIGRLCVFDLANLGAGVHVLTNVRGRADSTGLRLGG